MPFPIGPEYLYVGCNALFERSFETSQVRLSYFQDSHLTYAVTSAIAAISI